MKNIYIMLLYNSQRPTQVPKKLDFSEGSLKNLHPGEVWTLRKLTSRAVELIEYIQKTSILYYYPSQVPYVGTHKVNFQGVSYKICVPVKFGF